MEEGFRSWLSPFISSGEPRGVAVGSPRRRRGTGQSRTFAGPPGPGTATAARRVIPSGLADKENGGGGLQAFLGRFAETPPENGLPERERRNPPAWRAGGASGAPLVELVGDFGQKRVSRGTPKRTWGAPVAPGRPSGRFLGHMVSRPGVEARKLLA